MEITAVLFPLSSSPFDTNIPNNFFSNALNVDLYSPGGTGRPSRAVRLTKHYSCHQIKKDDMG
jgi:hypothetical protein